MTELRTTPLIQTLVRRGLTISCAESLTGGLLAAELIAPTGASEAMLGGIVAYSSAAKSELLHVAANTIATHGTVSAHTAREMALGARAAFNSAWALATTGVAGPGSHEGHPAGTVYLAVVGPEDGHAGPRTGVATQLQRFSGSRDEIRHMATQSALALLARFLDLPAGTNLDWDALT